MSKSEKMRIAVGEPNGRRSSTWLVWFGRTDIYVAARSLSSMWKYSAHFPRPPERPTTFRYVGYTSEHAHRRGGGKSTRRVQIRPDPHEIGPSVFVEAVVRIPESELRPMTGKVEGICWIRPPPPGMTTQLQVISGPAAFILKHEPMTCIREVELEGDRKVWVLYGELATNLEELSDARRRLAALKTTLRGPTPPSDTRVAMFGLIEERTAVAIEVAIDSGGVGI